MKISIVISDSDMMFDRITIRTREKTFEYANAVIGNCLSDVYQYYDHSEIVDIHCWRYKL